MATQRSESQTAAIVRVPGICGGSPTIEGTRIRVADIVGLQRIEGESVEGILEGYPHLSREQVEAALAFYEQNRSEIDRYMEEEAALYARELKRQRQST